MRKWLGSEILSHFYMSSGNHCFQKDIRKN